jgi:DNA-binding PadR family transcriptional regulator
MQLPAHACGDTLSGEPDVGKSACPVRRGEIGSHRKVSPSLLLYHRLEKLGWIKPEWRTSEHNQRAKYYKLTAAGKKQLVSEYSRWNQMSAAIRSLMSPGESEGQA